MLEQVNTVQLLKILSTLWSKISECKNYHLWKSWSSYLNVSPHSPTINITPNKHGPVITQLHGKSTYNEAHQSLDLQRTFSLMSRPPQPTNMTLTTKLHQTPTYDKCISIHLQKRRTWIVHFNCKHILTSF
jgi:hypothetical protein